MRAELDRRKCETACRLRKLNDGLMVRIGGLVLLRQRPSTARGITFVTLEDETGVINLILHAHVWQKYREVAHTAKVWLVDGQLQRQGIVVHVVAARLVNFTNRDSASSKPTPATSIDARPAVLHQDFTNPRFRISTTRSRRRDRGRLCSRRLGRSCCRPRTNARAVAS